MPAVRAETTALTARGERTRRRLLAAGEEVFGRRGFQFASIAEITQAAGVAQGTFYLYFDNKRDLMCAVVEEGGHELRATLSQATAAIAGRVDKEKAGFVAFFAWMARHRSLCRVVRQAEYIDADLYRGWYRQLADGYAEGLRAAMGAGEIAAVDDVETLAYALMGVGDFVGMHWLVFEDRHSVPPRAVETVVSILERALAAAPAAATGSRERRGVQRS
jgi:AcrR family transcriptional regulator